MAANEKSSSIEQDCAARVQGTLEHLQELSNLARESRRRRRADLPAGAQRAAFVDFELATAEARGFLTCLVSLDLLTEADEVAWYEYLNGTRAAVPRMTP